MTPRMRNQAHREFAFGRRPRLSCERERGVTFIELMIVIVIMGILIAVSTANLKGRSQKSALIGSSREIAACFNAARQAAITSERDVLVKFDVDNDRWRLDLNVSADEEDAHAHYDRDALYDLEQIRSLPPKISFISVVSDDVEQSRKRTIPFVTFFPSGSATGAAVQIESELGRKMTIEVARATGRVEVYEGEPRSFAEKLKALGVEPSAFGAEPTPVPGQENDKAEANDPNAERRVREQEQREQYYQDVVSRIVGERKKQLESTNRTRR